MFNRYMTLTIEIDDGYNIKAADKCIKVGCTQRQHLFTTACYFCRPFCRRLYLGAGIWLNLNTRLLSEIVAVLTRTGGISSLHQM